MQDQLQAVFFDVDGVLVDSLDDHLSYCREKASEFGLKLVIPSKDTFRQLVRDGKKVSPMRDFFTTVGFPVDKIDQAVKDYEREFVEKRPLKIFDGAKEMLVALHGSGVKLGLVTSNVKKNVESALKDAIYLFESECCFFLNDGKTKSDQIIEGARILKIDPLNCVYVGDQRVDEIAAEKAGCKFVGVTYGWGFTDGLHVFEAASNATTIPRAAYSATTQIWPKTVDQQFDYAWKWFSYHADQRIKMFNYMLLVFGLFTTAIVSALDKQLSPIIPIGLCIVAGAMALIFSRIDKRNQELVWLGEDVLIELERNSIFGLRRFVHGRWGKKNILGILWRQESEQGGTGTKGVADYVVSGWRGKHRVLLRLMAMLLCGMFLLSACLIAFFGVEKVNPIPEAKLYFLLL